MQRAPSAAATLIDAVGVGKAFHSRGLDIEALRDVTMHVGHGEFVSVLGPSGCGKTTLLRLIGGLDEPTSGSIHIDGGRPSAARGAKAFGLVPQSPALVPWKTLGDNVRFLSQLNRSGTSRPALADAQVDQLIDVVGLTAFTRSYPHQLSGGMRQRVSLVRAFALDAPVLLMDEPFAALDEITRGEMRYLLAELWSQQQRTVVFVTHSIAEAVILSDRVLVMGAQPGHIAAEHVIDLPRPRTPDLEDDAAFHAIVKAVRVDLRDAHGSRERP